MISIAVLDLFERVGDDFLRCRFPEFVKANMVGLIGAVGAVSWRSPPLFDGGHVALSVAALSCLGIAFTLLIDVFLSVRHGLAVVVVLLGASNGVAALAAVAVFGRFGCGVPAHASGGGGGVLIRSICPASGYVVPLAGGFALSLLLYAGALRRGLFDVGFTSAMLMAQRRRERG